MKFYFNLILVIFFSIPALASTTNSTLNKSIDTPNFKIIYNENSSEVAHILADNIERWGAEVYMFLGQKVNFKITVFVNNDVDIVNAFSAFTIVSLYLNNNSSSYNVFGNNWLESTFKHELAHNVTRIHHYGFWGGIVFSTMRDIFTPGWTHEGISVLTESKTTSEGRISNPTFWSDERFLVGNNENYYFYYMNDSSYLDGGSFMDFYYNIYGQEETIKAYSNYGNRGIIGDTNMLFVWDWALFKTPIPYFAANIDKSKDELLAQWQDYVQYKYRTEKSNYIEGENVDLTHARIYKLLGKDKRDNLVAYIGIENLLTNIYQRYIVKINADGKIIEKTLVNPRMSSVHYNAFDDSFTFTLYNSNSFTGSVYNEAYSSSIGGVITVTNKIRKPVKPIRPFRIVKSNDGCFYYLSANNEKSALLDCNNKELIAFDENQIMEHLNYDEARNILYLVAGRMNETIKYIYIYDLNNNQLIKVIEGLDPYISGDNLYFSYAKLPDGIFNIYEYNLETKDLRQITDTKYGAFQPIIIDNKLYYAGYSLDRNKILINGLFSLDLTSINSKKVTSYSAYEIDKPYQNTDYIINNQYFQSVINVDGTYAIEEKKNNYFSPIFIPGVYTNFEDLTLDFLLGTGKHELELGLFDGKPFISFSKSNFVSSGAMMDLPNLYKISFLGQKDGSQNVTEVHFNPIVLNGYGYMPIVSLTSEANSLGGYGVGGVFSGRYETLSYSFLKPKTDDTGSSSYHQASLSYRIFSAKAIKVIDNKDITLGYNPVDSESSKNIWREDNVNSLYQAKIKVPFTLFLYKGTKEGTFGYNALTVSPSFIYVYSEDSMHNNTKTTILSTTFSNKLRITANVNLSLNVIAYTSDKRYSNSNNPLKDKGVAFSITI